MYHKRKDDFEQISFVFIICFSIFLWVIFWVKFGFLLGTILSGVVLVLLTFVAAELSERKYGPIEENNHNYADGPRWDDYDSDCNDLTQHPTKKDGTWDMRYSCNKED